MVTRRAALIGLGRLRDPDGDLAVLALGDGERDDEPLAATDGDVPLHERAPVDVDAFACLGLDEAEVLLLVEPEHLPVHVLPLVG